MGQKTRFVVYIVAAFVGLAMIVLSLVFPDEWGIDKQISLLGQIITWLTAILAAVKSNPVKNLVIPADQLGQVQDVLPTSDELVDGPEDAEETVEGPEEHKHLA